MNFLKPPPLSNPPPPPQPHTPLILNSTSPPSSSFKTTPLSPAPPQLPNKPTLKYLTRETLTQFKKDLKRLGYKAKLIHFSDHTACKVVHLKSGLILNYGNVFTKEFLKEHEPAFQLINKFISMVVNKY